MELGERFYEGPDHCQRRLECPCTLDARATTVSALDSHSNFYRAFPIDSAAVCLFVSMCGLRASRKHASTLQPSACKYSIQAPSCPGVRTLNTHALLTGMRVRVLVRVVSYRHRRC